jgi:phosphoribosyl-AMP cyclohydrolase
MEDLLDGIHFRIPLAGEDLAIGIAQDWKGKEVLMVAFVNREALRRTLETGKVHYFSTSRKKIWQKGESSGHVQLLREVRVDCDQDAVLFLVEQVEASCHEGYRSCFFRRVRDGKLETVGERVFDPEEVYR